ncbi:MAG: LptA/OstA family protein [Terracidiphilus sp.]
MRLTIERMRALVLGAGALLVAAIVLFLAVGKWENPFNRRDLPDRLGVEIEQQANGVTYTQTREGRTLFKIHASRVVELRQGMALLHDVQIELYGADGKGVDRIEGNEFEYNQPAGTATAAGPVELWLMRPGAPQTVAPAAGQTAGTVPDGAIHVKTRGLTFNQNSGVATSSQPVEFSMAQGTGSSTGAAYDSQRGILVLDRAVKLTVHHGGGTVRIHAQHADFERDSRVLRLSEATADFSAGEATAGEAEILFREDGSAARLDASNGFTMRNATGGRLRAAAGELEFNGNSQPRDGHMEGGVGIDSTSEAGGRSSQLHGTAPEAYLAFSAQGELRNVRLERGVAFESESEGKGTGLPQQLIRRWRSPVADVDFHTVGRGRAEPADVRGTGGVTVTSESRSGQRTVAWSRLSAETLTGVFAPVATGTVENRNAGTPGLALVRVFGAGKATIEETAATGARESTCGDRLQAHLAAPGAGSAVNGETQIESATVEGHVVLTETPAARPGAPAPATLMARASRADYAGSGQWLHLMGSPRIENGAMQLTADRIDVSRSSGEAFARGDVKASWIGNGAGTVAARQEVLPGAQGPAHAVAVEAELNQANDEITFRGRARLWQQGNSVAAPVIIVNRQSQTLMARSRNASEPVQLVLVSDAAPEKGRATGGSGGREAAVPARPAVIRVRAGDLTYSDAARTALMRAGVLPAVVAETEEAASASDEVDVVLRPPIVAGGHRDWQGQVERLTARGHVTLTSEGRRGTGEQLVYTSSTGEYILTGTAAVPPRMTDPQRGSITGQTLIFDGRDDSVRVEGGSGKTRTETTAPRAGSRFP